MNLKLFTSLAFVFCTIISLSGQTTLTLQPGASQGQDALLHGLSSEVNVNYGSNAQFASVAWTFNGTPGVVRSAIKFDLSSIPTGARIDSAFLSLFAWDSVSGFGQHSTRSGSNAGWLQRITSDWDESTVTWNTAPTFSTQNQVALPASSSPTEDYLKIDVLSLVQDMVDDPSTSFGFMMSLQDETVFRLLNFASSNHADSSLHPKLVIVYEEQVFADTCITLQPNAAEGQDALLHGLPSEATVNYGSNAQLAANAWTFGGEGAVVRSALNFDFSGIPADARIDSAFLSLYAWDSLSGFGQHSTRSGANDVWIQRITSSWDESTVTWNTQPTFTTDNRVAIPASTSPTQDYLKIDVTPLLKDIVDNPTTSFGFLLSLQDESFYRLMNFASSDHADSTRHPKIKICYAENITSIKPPLLNQVKFELYPNPAKDWVRIVVQNPESSNITVEILNLQGQIVKKMPVARAGAELDVSGMSAGIYYVRITDGFKVSSKKLLLE